MAVKDMTDELTRLANNPLEVGPWSVMDKPLHDCGVMSGFLTTKGRCHDFFHVHPSCWPVYQPLSNESDYPKNSTVIGTPGLGHRSKIDWSKPLSIGRNEGPTESPSLEQLGNKESMCQNYHDWWDTNLPHG
jgi:hypothetical protein